MKFIDEKTQQFYDDLNQRMKEAEEEAQRMRQNNRMVHRICTTGNVLRSLSNLMWTVKGAPPQEIPSVADEDQAYEDRISKQRERMMKAYESLARLRMADARTTSAIDYQESRRRNEEKQTNALIQYQQNRENNENRKTDAEIDNIHSRSNLANSQAALVDQQTEGRRQENANLPARQEQESEIRRARAQQAWAAAHRQQTIKPRTTLRTVRRRRRR